MLVTGTLTVVVFAATFTLAGTVAAPVLLELRLILNPPGGAAYDRFNVRFCVAMPVIERLAGEKLIVAPTCTVWLPEV